MIPVIVLIIIATFLMLQLIELSRRYVDRRMPNIVQMMMEERIKMMWHPTTIEVYNDVRIKFMLFPKENI